MLLVGLSGKAGSGKSTVSDILCKYHGFFELSLASPLKEMIHDIFFISSLESKDKNVVIPRLGVSLRTLYQRIGTDIFRHLIHDVIPELKWTTIWVEHAAERIKQLKRAGKTRVVISDVRFDDEVGLIRDHGGMMIQIHRPGLEPPFGNEEQNHESETNVLAHDITISNDADISQLEKTVATFVDFIDMQN